MPPSPRCIGIIADRHEMPVEEYLVERVRPGQSAYDEVYEVCASWLRRHPEAGREPAAPLEIYYSGLTEATLAVADAVHNFDRQYARLMRFDVLLQEYESLQRKRNPCTTVDEPSAGTWQA